MKLIGKGTFSKVYQYSETQVLIKSTCYAKECLALFIDNPCFPKLISQDDDSYLCEYYPKVKSLKESLDAKHYAIYKELCNLSVSSVKNSHDYYYAWRAAFETVSDFEYREALLDMIDNLINYGAEIGFEISPRNVAVKNGKLILLDVFFMRDQLQEIRNTQRQKHYAYA